MKRNQNLYILVLSNGNYDGLGKIREKEMEKAAKYMGFKDFHVVDDEGIPEDCVKIGVTAINAKSGNVKSSEIYTKSKAPDNIGGV